jgi:ATP-dependent Lhr-like helicase
LSEGQGFNYLSDALRRAALQIGLTRPTPPQVEASPKIAAGENVLVVAPTGSGKTEAALLPVLNRILNEGKKKSGISLLYLTPMRALNRDLLRRLSVLCESLGLTVEVRHGDTPHSVRNRQSQKPPDVMISTPETLQALLPGRRMRENLSGLRAVIVDELHELVESKRGVQLSVGLERLKEVAGNFQLIALSATLGSPLKAAEFIFGGSPPKVVQAMTEKEYRFVVRCPTPDEDDYAVSESTYSPLDLACRLSHIDRLIEAHKSTLIFVNSRTLAEMLGEKLLRLRNDVGVHHGSLPREERERVESAFKAGELRALVCTSTLELGIDVGSVDLVIQYMSPRQVTSLVQRVGRSGHRLGRVSEGELVSVSPEDVLESCAAILEARKGRLEETVYYENSLDVLAHQVAGYLMDFGEMDGHQILSRLRKASPYRTLSDEAFWKVVKYLSEIRKVGTAGERLFRTRGTREYYYQNLSMIPDETRYEVVDLATNERIGILGEEFVLLRARVGVHVILKGRVWQVEKIADDRKIFVTSVDDPLAAVPGWDGEMLPIPKGLAESVGMLRKKVLAAIQELGPANAVTSLTAELPAEMESVKKVVEEIDEHRLMGAPVPSDDLILVEGFGKYLVLHMCFGERVNRAFGFSVEELLSRRGLVRLWWMDGYRVLFELTAETEELGLESLSKQIFDISPDELEKLYSVAAQRNFPFPGRVKTIAERFGAISRGKYISHPNLCSLPTRFESTPIYDEALQETGRDLIDMENAKELLRRVSVGAVRVATFQARERPTPIAYHILYKYLDTPETVAPDQLAKSTVQKMKIMAMSTAVELLCMKCGTSSGVTTIGKLRDEPTCSSCCSSLLTPLYWGGAEPVALLRKKLAGESLTEEERNEVARLRRAADLVLSYGKRAVVALSVYGIGPQTASRILAKMPEEDDEFYRELLDAKLRFISTRPYWRD